MMKKILFYLGVLFGKPLLSFLFGANRQAVINGNVLREVLNRNESVIICCWHGRLLFPFYFFRHRNYYALASLHEDAEIISRVGGKMGWRMLRGSTSRGGKEAYGEMLTVLRERGNVIGMTPDGPCGPSHKAKAGAVKAAVRTGATIIPFSGQSSRRWRIVNWDTFVVPKPFGKIQFAFGNPIRVADTDAFEHAVEQLEKSLNRVEEEADAHIVGKV